VRWPFVAVGHLIGADYSSFFELVKRLDDPVSGLVRLTCAMRGSSAT
jgi:hypothetical protein